MIQDRAFLLNGALCLASMWFAAYAKQGRREAITASLSLCGNFLFCALAFTPLAPKFAFQALGLDLTHKETWMLADTALGGACVLLGHRYWWGYALCAMCAAQVGIHAARGEHVIDAAAYSEILDIVLHAQMAVFLALGGPKIGDLLHSNVARFFAHRGPKKASAFVSADQDR